MAEADHLLVAVTDLKINSDEPEGELDLDATSPTRMALSKTIIQVHQSYFNWMDDKEFEKFREGFANDLAEIISDRFLVSSPEPEDISLKYRGTALICNKGSLAYFQAFTGNIVEAKAALAEGRDFVRVCSKKHFLEEEYLSGFDYVFDCLEVYLITIVEQENVSEEGARLWKALPNYEEFGPKTQAAVLVMKYYFFMEIRKDEGEQLKIVAEMVTLDPDNFHWHMCKAAIARRRRRNQGALTPPNKNFQMHKDSAFTEEIRELELAKRLAPNHPLCMMDCCQLLAEIAKSTRPILRQCNWQVPVKFGSLAVHSFEELTGFLKNECKKILEMYNQSVYANTAIADIFSKLLPGKYRDFVLAESCLLRALELHPKSSKANHRLASFHLTKHPQDFALAEKYCLLAIEYDWRNVPACAELIQILLGNPKENEARILEMIDSKLEDMASPLADRYKADLHFYKGILLHLKSGFEIEATENWILSQELGSNTPFEWLYSSCSRYKWPASDLTLLKLRETINYAKEHPQFGAGKNAEIAKLLGLLQKAEQKEASFLAQQSNRGGGAGYGDSRGRGSSGGHRGTGGGEGYRGRGHGQSAQGYSGGTGTGGGYRGRGSGYRGRGDFRGANSGSSSSGVSTSGMSGKAPRT